VCEKRAKSFCVQKRATNYFLTILFREPNKNLTKKS